jgi:DNA repair exonuclease SbcCD ATPase subunit
MAWRLLPLLLLLAACAGGPWPGPTVAAPPDDTERLVRAAEERAREGAHAEAARLFEEVTRRPSPAFGDRALLGLARLLADPAYAGRDYRQAYLAADRLLREYPDSCCAAEARAWRDLIGAYLSRGQALEQRTLELERYAQELDRLKRVDLELERRTQELEQRTQELDRLRRVDLELERRTQELERRTQELERLKRLDLELEQQRRKP